MNFTMGFGFASALLELLGPCLVHPENQKVFKIPVTSNLSVYA